MRDEWKSVRLGELITIKHGYAFEGKGITTEDTGSVLVTPGNFNIGGGFKFSGKKFWRGNFPSEYLLAPNSIIVTMTDLSKAGDTLGFGARIPKELEYRYLHNQRIGLVQVKTDEVNEDYLYWTLRSPTYHQKVVSSCTGTTVKHTSPSRIADIEITLPPLATQKKIAAVLGALDDKIELNRKMNANLEAQAQALFKSWFVDFEPFGGKMPEGWKKGIAADFFDISIGKTPPRKQQELFSKQQTGNMVWVSIADMGRCGTFIAESSEYLTPNAVSECGVTVVPQDTVLLSFKLTVGRVAIAGCELTTNEAIAHFKTRDVNLREYTYLSLKCFEFNLLGSTSSIATAVNSKTIKAMPFVRPANDVLKKFSQCTRPLFEKMRLLSSESRKLAETRDALLPKLMKGEIEA